jgi:enediyne biosynthesis protein E7
VVIGSIPASIANARAFGRNPVGFYRRLTGSGGGYRAAVPFDLFGPNLLINDPELVGAVLTSPSGQRFGKEGLRFFSVLRRLLGDGLFTVDGQPHRLRRRLVHPVLQPRSLRPAAAAMTRAAEHLRAEWTTGPERVVDVEDAAGRVALDLLAHALAGPELADRVSELGQLFTSAERSLLHVLEAPVVFPPWVRTPGNHRLRRGAEAMRVRAEALLREPVPPDTLLGQLVERAGPERARLLDELVTLVVAGHHSTAASIGFTLYLLARHPEYARLVAEEASAVLAGRAATVDDLPALPHTALVVAESMRLYPPVWIITRRTLSAQRLGERTLARGTVVHICPHTLHRNPVHWPDPDSFRPERFAGSTGRHSFAYVPFGGGPHKCVGNHFALMATAIVVATIAPAVRFAPPAELRVSARSFTVAEHGLRLRLLRELADRQYR